jgi:hypothetical protein
MEARVVAAIEQRLAVSFAVASRGLNLRGAGGRAMVEGRDRGRGDRAEPAFVTATLTGAGDRQPADATS